MTITLWKYISDTDNGTDCSLYKTEFDAYRAMVSNLWPDDSFEEKELAIKRSIEAAIEKGNFDQAHYLVGEWLQKGSIDSHRVEMEEIALEPPAPFSSRELATVLHALRMMQEIDDKSVTDGCLSRHRECDHFDDEPPLTVDEIDNLCMRINLGADGKLKIEGGAS